MTTNPLLWIPTLAVLSLASVAHAQSQGMVIMVGEATRVERDHGKVTYWFADGTSWTLWPDDANSGKIAFYTTNGIHVDNPNGGADRTKFALLEQSGDFYVMGSLGGKTPAWSKIETPYNTLWAPLGYTLGGLDPMGVGQWWFEMWW
jgi:hypothetical protein